MSHASDEATPPASVHTISVRTMSGGDVPLSDYAGRVLLIVNTASRCGFTPQYEALESMANRHRDRGFEVLAFPCDDFLRQEPGTDEEILEFCQRRFDLHFPVFSKLHVKGPKMHPLYTHLTKASDHAGAVRWNFTKFLIDRHGRTAARFEPNVSPGSAPVSRAIQELLESA